MHNPSFFEYVPELILLNNVLVRTNEEVETELLLYELMKFKEKFDTNHRFIVSFRFG